MKTLIIINTVLVWLIIIFMIIKPTQRNSTTDEN
jgi:preprotein translocase subunit YajC